jgi:hypothetical protein
MREKAANPECDRCHAPLAALASPGELAIEEGVTCEACHSIREAAEGPSGIHYTHELADNRKYGPLCDAKDIYFHKMGCSPLHREATLCGGCHAWTMPVKGGTPLPIFTEFTEWKSTSYATAGVTCQDCHMPSELSEVASGASRKTRMGNHSFGGPGSELARRALGVTAQTSEQEGRLKLEVTLKNEGAGHAVPGGMPGRQIVVRARTIDASGHETAREERILSRVLMDELGREAPFYAARTERADDRLRPSESRTFVFSSGTAGTRAIALEIAWRSASPEILVSTGVAVEERIMASVTIPFDAPQPGKGSKRLPRTIKVRP